MQRPKKRLQTPTLPPPNQEIPRCLAAFLTGLHPPFRNGTRQVGEPLAESTLLKRRVKNATNLSSTCTSASSSMVLGTTTLLLFSSYVIHDERAPFEMPRAHFPFYSTILFSRPFLQHTYSLFSASAGDGSSSSSEPVRHIIPRQ